MTKNRFGSISSETIALILLILSSYLGDMFLSRYGEYWGYAGIILGPIIFWTSIQSIAWLERQLFIGQEPLPSCQCGLKPINELKDAADAKPYIAGNGKKVCKCGLYLIGRGVITHKANEGSEATIYALWEKGSWQKPK